MHFDYHSSDPSQIVVMRIADASAHIVVRHDDGYVDEHELGRNVPGGVSMMVFVERMVHSMMVTAGPVLHERASTFPSLALLGYVAVWWHGELWMLTSENEKWVYDNGKVLQPQEAAHG
jgi:hypothetical protein